MNKNDYNVLTDKKHWNRDTRSTCFSCISCGFANVFYQIKRNDDHQTANNDKSNSMFAHEQSNWLTVSFILSFDFSLSLSFTHSLLHTYTHIHIEFLPIECLKCAVHTPRFLFCINLNKHTEQRDA